MEIIFVFVAVAYNIIMTGRSQWRLFQSPTGIIVGFEMRQKQTNSPLILIQDSSHSTIFQPYRESEAPPHKSCGCGSCQVFVIIAFTFRFSAIDKFTAITGVFSALFSCTWPTGVAYRCWPDVANLS